MWSKCTVRGKHKVWTEMTPKAWWRPGMGFKGDWKHLKVKEGSDSPLSPELSMVFGTKGVFSKQLVSTCLDLKAKLNSVRPMFPILNLSLASLVSSVIIEM
jgi:hypothetical protein